MSGKSISSPEKNFKEAIAIFRKHCSIDMTRSAWSNVYNVAVSGEGANSHFGEENANRKKARLTYMIELI